MKITFSSPTMPAAGAYAVGVLDGNRLTPAAAELDKKTDGALTRALGASRFKGAPGDVLSILAPAAVPAERIVLFGLGKPAEITELTVESAGGHVYAQLAAGRTTGAAVALDSVKSSDIKAPTMAAHFAYGALLRSYRFDKYRTREKKEDKPALRTLAMMVDNPAAAKRVFEGLERVADGVALTRDLVSEPANIIYPQSLAQRAKSLTKLGVKVEVLDEKQIKKLGMGLLLGVAQGSERPPRVVVMQWRGNPKAKNKNPIGFVGKGVTFDSGGLSLKTPGGMEDMKWDMGGAGVVIGLMGALAGRKAKVNAVGVVGLVENMPSGKAQRPGDIVTSMSGQTVEVLNTDAEGRLVLGDALWYCKERFKPQLMINLATLTGAIIVALGHEYAGLFSNDDKLADQLHAAGKSVGEGVWRFPLGEPYDKMLNTDSADMKNVTGSRGAGSITAAQFLKRFVGKVPWAHIDIAGMTWSKKDAPTVPKGGTGFGVRLLDRFVRDNYEGK